MITILSLLIITTVNGITLPPEIMLSHQCRRDVMELRFLMATMPGARLDKDGETVASIECRPYRIKGPTS
jgi:hypothetical protein